MNLDRAARLAIVISSVWVIITAGTVLVLQPQFFFPISEVGRISKMTGTAMQIAITSQENVPAYDAAVARCGGLPNEIDAGPWEYQKTLQCRTSDDHLAMALRWLGLLLSVPTLIIIAIISSRWIRAAPTHTEQS